MAELWSLQLDDARRDLEEALALARRIGRPYLEVGCLGQLALAAVVSGAPIPDALRLSEDAVAIAEAHGWGTHRIVAPAVAAVAPLSPGSAASTRPSSGWTARSCAGRRRRSSRRSPFSTTRARSCGLARVGSRKR